MTCRFRGCGRKVYARGWCQSHHRQLLIIESYGPDAPEKMTAIRPYRPREPGTAKLGGLRLPGPVAKAAMRHAKKRGMSIGAVLADWVTAGAAYRAMSDLVPRRG